MKATLFQRFIAYIIDIILLGIILSIISASSINGSNYNDLLEEQETLINNLANEEVTIEDYNKEIKRLDYEISKSNYPSTIIGLVINIAYFILFQFFNKGQTIGKKLMKIKIRKRDDKELKIQDIIIRALIINSIISTAVALIGVKTLNVDDFYTLKTIFGGLETIFVLVSAFMILYRKDKLGLQDIITNTEVVKEGN